MILQDSAHINHQLLSLHEEVTGYTWQFNLQDHLLKPDKNADRDMEISGKNNP